MKITLLSIPLRPAITSIIVPLHYHNRGRATKLIRRYAEFINELSIHNGAPTALAVAKSLANIIKKAALGQSNIYDYPIALIVDGHKVPMKLRGFRRFYASNSPVLKAVAISISNLYRIALARPKISYEDVLDTYKGDMSHSLCEFLDFIKVTFIPKYRRLIKQAKRHRYLHDMQETVTMTTSSPSGQNSAFSSHLDASALLFPSSSIYMDAVSHVYKCFDASHKYENLLSLGEINRSHHEKRAILAEYRFLADKGGKTRGITLANYYLQDSLRPLHDDLMYVLAKIPNDFTYKQDTVIPKILEYYNKGYQAFCFDMTGATDRFPRKVQSYLIKQIYGLRFAKSWDALMSVPLAHANNMIRFNTGQPMGLYSSFSVFAFTHHALIQYCLHKTNAERHLYMLLGDDIVIFHKRAAELYRTILTKVLGVKVSMHKSILSYENLFCAEFCKKVVLNGADITPVGSGLLAQPVFDLPGIISKINMFEAWGRNDNFIRATCLQYLINCLAFAKLRPEAVAIYCHMLPNLSDGFRSRIIEKVGVTREISDHVRNTFISMERRRLVDRFVGSQDLIEKVGKTSLSLAETKPGSYLHPYVQEINNASRELSSAIAGVTMYNSRSKVVDLKELDERLKDCESKLFVFKGLVSLRKKEDKTSDEYLRQEIVRKIRRINVVIARLECEHFRERFVSQLKQNKLLPLATVV